MPLVQVVLFGFALRSDVRNVRIAFVEPAPDAATVALRNRFAATNRFRVVARVRRMDDVEPLFRRGEADVAIVTEPDFASHLSAGDTAHVAVIIDASDPNTGRVIRNYAQAALAAHEGHLTANPGPTRALPQVATRLHPTLESVN